MYTIHLSYDPTRPMREQRRTTLHELMIAEIIRFRDHCSEWYYAFCAMGMDTESAYALSFPYSTDTFSAYHDELSREYYTIPLDRSVKADSLCIQCGKVHDQVWTIRRVLADTMGPWGIFRINGKYSTLGSITTNVDRLPRDAVKLDPTLLAHFWHS